MTGKVLIAALAVGGACSVAAYGQAPPPAAPLPDASFVQNAYTINQSEIREARAVVDRAGIQAPLHRYAQLMIDDHSQANVALRSAARAAKVPLGNLTAPPPMMPAAWATLSGKPLSQAFFTQAVTDHQRALQLFSGEATNGTSPSLREYAAQQVPVIQRHLELAQAYVNTGMLPELPPNAGPSPMASPSAPPNGPQVPLPPQPPLSPSPNGSASPAPAATSTRSEAP